MSGLVIKGGRPLSGNIEITGAKNSILPLLAATILCDGKSIIHNCPRLSDVDTAVKILEGLGCRCSREDSTIIVDSSGVAGYEIPENLMREMRSSIVFLGAIAGRCKKAKLSSPGGCELGPRPIDLHLAALRQMGLRINEDHGFLRCAVGDCLRGATISLSLPSVGATENIMLAAATARGITIIRNAAREPEISDLARFLNNCGARISGAGSDTVLIDGVESLKGSEHTAIPDRITAATFMAATAITGGNVFLNHIEPLHIYPVLSTFRAAGCEIDLARRGLHIKAPPKLDRIPTVRTMAYPGFPTDAGPPTLAMMTLSRGASLFVENIFSNRFKFVEELRRLSADIKLENNIAIVEGVKRLTGAPVMAEDLRGGAALVVAGLAASGTTYVGGVHHIDRGYDHIEESLAQLGADIKRE